MSRPLDTCRVELDEVPLLGTFVEIEGPTEAAIEAALERLGLAGQATEPKSYVGLSAERADDRKLGVFAGIGKYVRMGAQSPRGGFIHERDKTATLVRQG